MTDLAKILPCPDRGDSPGDFSEYEYINMVSLAVRRLFQAAPYTPQMYDGGTDSEAIQAAIDDCSNNGGGIVYCPPIGEAYTIDAGLTVPNNVTLCGATGKNFEGSTATIEQWTARGTWFHVTEDSDPAVTLAGHGSGIEGVGFIYGQTPPSGGGWTPTTFPYAIKVTCAHFTIKDIVVVDGTHGIWLAYDEEHGGGTLCTMRDLFLSTFVRGIKFDRVNDTLSISNVRHRNLFYNTNADVVEYIEANKVDWEMGYLDNAKINDVEFFQSRVAILCDDQTCLGNTHSMFNCKFSNIDFNLVNQAIAMVDGDVTVKAMFSNVMGQTDIDTGIISTMFDLGSDNVDLIMSNMRINAVGGRVINLGDGATAQT